MSNIPTGADYHILAAKSGLQDMERASRDIPNERPEWYAAHYAGVAIEHLIKALELIQREREKEKTP